MEKFNFWKKRGLLLALILMLSSSGFAQVQVGNGTDVSQDLPINAYYGYSYSQQIYHASEINASGTIDTLWFDFAGSSLSVSNGWIIYIGHTTKTSFTGISDWVSLSALTQVYSDTFADPAASGLIAFDITDWTYNGTDNIVIAVEENVASYDGSSDEFYATLTPGITRGLIAYSDNATIDPANPPTTSAYPTYVYSRDAYPNIIFGGIQQTCPPPSNIAVSNIGSDSAVVSWTTGGSTNWNLEYGPTGFIPGSGTTITNVSNPYTINGLSGASTYDVYVQDSCGMGDVSSWTGPFTFTTALSGLPFYESFENDDIGLFTQATTDDHDWSTNSGGTSSSNTGPTGASDGTYYAYCETSSPVAYGEEFILESPEFDFSVESGPALLFDYHMYFDGAQDGTLAVEVSTDNKSTWTPVWSISGDQGQNWNSALINLSSYMSSSSVYFRFHFTLGTSGTYSYVYDAAIDNIQLINITCYPSTNLAATNIGNNSADLSWTTGGASTWMIEYGLQGFTPGTGTVVTTTQNPYTLSNLSMATDYDFYVRDICQAGDSSLWVGPATFATTAPALSGVYTIGDTTGGATYDFPDFSSAVNNLIYGGVTGPVTFNVASGNYNEQLVIDSIPGASATNTVTFQSNSGDSTDVVLEYASTGSTDLHTVLLNNVHYLTFKQMTIKGSATDYGRVITMENSPSNITIENCIIEAPIYSSSYSCPIYSIDNPMSNLTIKNNHIKGGYYGMYIDGSSSIDVTGLVIDNNYVEDYYYYGIYSYYSYGAQFKNNIVRNSSNSGSVYGLYAYYADQATITANDINISGTSSHYGIYFRGEGTSATPNLIANNLVNLSGTGTSTWYGMRIYYADTTNVYHNTVSLTGGSSSSGALYFYYGDDNTSMNNIAANYGGGYAIYTNSSSNVTSSDYNVYYTTGSNLAYWSGAEATLADLQTASTMDMNSMSANPVFTDNNADLTPLSGSIDNVGTPIPSITTDIYGNVRPATTPDVGAIEFTGLSSDIQLADAMLINGECLSSNDSIYVSIANVIGSTIDFSVNPLTVVWTSTGPVNSNGTFTINTGTIAPATTGMFGSDGVDMSVPGDYTVSAYIMSNSINSFAGNDTLNNHSTNTVIDPFVAYPAHSVITNNNSDVVDLTVQSPYFPGGDVFLTEICHYAGSSTGEPTSGQPTYLGDDYVELTGVPGSDLSGYTFEKWSSSGSSPSVTHTFPAGTSFSPSGTYVLSTYQGSTSLADYHQVADVTSSFGSTTNSINIIKDPTGTIVDVVLYETGSTIPAAAGVSSSDWSGPGIDGSSSWGIRLTGADTDDNTNWVKADGSPTLQDPNVANAGVTVPTGGTITGFSWTHNSSVVSTNVDYTAGPYTTEGTYEYIATYTSATCGAQVDTAVIEVVDPKIDTFPYVETFEVDPNVGPLGWNAYATSSYHWEMGMNTPSSSTGADMDHTTGSGYFIYTEASSGSLNDSTMVITPELDFSSIISPKMNFWYHMHGADMGKLYIDAYVGSMWISAIDSIVGEQQANQSDAWMMKSVDLGMYANADSIRFTALRGDGLYGDISIDDVAFGTDLNIDIAADTAICDGASITFDAGFDPNWTYEWYVDTMDVVAATTQMITVDSAAKYYVKVTGIGGFSGIDSVTLTINPTPVVSLTSQMGPSYCVDDAADTLMGTPTGGVYSGNGVAANTFSPALAGVGTHMIHYTYTNATGCSSTDTIMLTVTPLPTVDAGMDTEVCMGDSATLMATTTDLFFSEYIEGSSNNKAIEFYNGTGSTLNLDDYAVLTNYNGNSWSGQYDFPTGTTLNHGETYLVVNSSAEANMIALADETLSFNDKGYMMGYNGDDVRALVKFAPNGDTIIIDQIGRYDLIDPGSGWDVAGVTNATQNHTLIRKPSAGPNYGAWDASAGTDSISSEWFVMPQNDTADLGMHTYNAATVSYLWSNGATTSSIKVAPSASMTYMVTVTDGNGCTNMDSVQVMVNPLPMVDLGPDTMFVCAADTAMLHADGFAAYSWSTGETNDTIMVDSAGVGLGSTMITLAVTDNNGCMNMDTIVLTFVDYPTVMITGPDTLKKSMTATLDAGAGFATYLWSTGATTQDIMIDSTNLNDGANTVSVTVTSMYGCAATADKDVYLLDDTGIEDINGNMDINLYPNPNNGIFTLEVNGPNADFNLEIMSVNGQLIRSEYINADKFSKQYDLSNLAKGVYYIRLYNDDMTQTQKLIIQ